MALAADWVADWVAVGSEAAAAADWVEVEGLAEEEAQGIQHRRKCWQRRRR